MPNMITDARSYYGSRFSPNLTVTPEGFLIAHNVPIARTGWYEYLASEIGAPGNDVVKVYRSPDEVFHPAAIASFEGKTVTDDHPPDPVTAGNATWFAKGTVQNVRQGKGNDADLLLADLVIYDQKLIDEIQEGKREVSAGYTCNYVDNGDGTYEQKDIRGNHVAVVDAGRAGSRVRIKDSEADPAKKYGIAEKPGKARSAPKGKPENREDYGDPVNYAYPIDREHIHAAISYFNQSGQKADGDYTPTEWAIIGKRIVEAANRLLGGSYEYEDGRIKTPDQTKEAKDSMAKKIQLPRKRSRFTDMLAAVGLKQFAADAEPEEIMDAVETLAEERHEGRDDNGDDDKKETKDTDPAIAALNEKIDKLAEVVTALVAQKDEHKDPLDAVEAEIRRLEGAANDDDDPDGSATIPADDMMDQNIEPGPITDPEDRPEPALDNAYRLQALKAIKPAIAAIQDPAQRKKAADAALAAIKGKPSGKSSYAGMTGKRQKPSNDNKPQAPVDYSQLGREWAKQHNPHYKNKN